MRFTFLVAWREYSENAKTKGFWIGLCMFPLLIFISVKGSVLLETKATPVRYYVLVDQSGKFASNINSHLEKFKTDWTEDASSRPRPYQPATLPATIDSNADLTSISSGLKPYLRRNKKVEANGGEVELYAAILIPRDIEQQVVRPGAKAGGTNAARSGIEYWAANLADTSLRDEVEKNVNNDIRRREYLARGMDIAAIKEVEQTHAPFASLNPTKEAGKEAVNSGDILRQWAPSGFVYLLWVSIFAISQMLLNNIIEEKSNRIIEVLLSSVTPWELMMGKLFGIAAIGPLRLAEFEIRRRPGRRRRRDGDDRPSFADIEDIEPGPDVCGLLSAGLHDVCGLHPRAGQRVQHHQRSAELHGHDHHAHDGPIADHDFYSERSKRHAGPGAFLDSDLHPVHHDEPGQRQSASVRSGRHTRFASAFHIGRIVDGGEDFPHWHFAHRPAAENY